MRCFALTALVVTGIALPSAARGDYYAGGGVIVTGGIGSLNLGELIGQPEDGENDLTGRRAGAFVRVGVTHRAIEVGPRLGIALGGLALARVERVYFDSDPQPIGGAGVVDAALELRIEEDLGASWIPYGGAAVGLERLAASSPSGSAAVDALFAEAAAGLSWTVGPRGPIIRGRLDAGVMLRVSGAYQVHMRGERSAVDTLRYYGSPGLSVSYTLRM
jgi:hypothetical protein